MRSFIALVVLTGLVGLVSSGCAKGKDKETVKEKQTGTSPEKKGESGKDNLVSLPQDKKGELGKKEDGNEKPPDVVKPAAGDEFPGLSLGTMPKKDATREAKLAADRNKRLAQLQIVDAKNLAALKKRPGEKPPGAVAEFGDIEPPLAFSPDGRFLAGTGQDAKGQVAIALIDLSTGKLMWAVPCKIRSIVQFSEDGSLFEIGRELKLRDLKTGEAKKGIPIREIASAVLSPNGKFLAIWKLDEPFSVLDVSTEKEVFKGLDKLVHNAAPTFSPSSELLACAVSREGKGTLLVFDPGTKKILRKRPYQDTVKEMQFSPDGWSLAMVVQKESGGQDLLEWALDSDEQRKIAETKSIFRALDYSPDGKLLVFGEGDDIVFFDLAKGERVRQFPGRTPLLSPGGRLLATQGVDIYDVNDLPNPKKGP